MTWDAGPNWTHGLARHLAVVLSGRCRWSLPDVVRLRDAADQHVCDAAVLKPLAEQAFLTADPVIHTALDEECYREYEEVVRFIFAKSNATPEMTRELHPA